MATKQTERPRGAPPAPPRLSRTRPCHTCEHPKREAIDRALVAGEHIAALSRGYAISEDSLSRHRAGHMPRATLAEAAEGRDVAEGIRGAALLAKASGLLQTAETVLFEARAEGDKLMALRGIREAARCVELCAKLTGEIDEGATINIAIAPQFLVIQAAILSALEPHPAARDAVLRALEHIPS